MQQTTKTRSAWFQLDVHGYLRRRQRAHLLIASALDARTNPQIPTRRTAVRCNQQE